MGGAAMGRSAAEMADLNRRAVDFAKLRLNAPRMNHAELDAATAIDPGDPQEFGALHRDMLGLLPALRVIGCCCGTDHRHLGCIADGLVRATRAA